jgi:hypothetical protein
MAGQGNRDRRPLNETNNDVGNFFDWFMNSTQTGVGTPQARNFGSSQPVLPAPASSASFADLRGSATPGSMEPAASNLGEGAAMDAAERSRPGAGYPAGVTRPVDYPVQAGGRGAAAPLDPNNTGARGTSMTYADFYNNIASKREAREGVEPRKGFEISNPFESVNLSGTAGYAATLDLNDGENPRSFDESMDAGKKADLNLTSSAQMNSVKEGVKSSMMEANRQLAVDQQNLGEDQVNIGLKGTGVDTSKEAENSMENLLKRKRAALLGDGHIMDNMREAEGVMGLMSQGGKKFARDPDAENGLRSITQDQYRARMAGGNMTEIMKPVKADSPIKGAKAKATARTEKVNKQKDA